MKYLVLYNDDYYDNGGVGFELFDDRGKAEAFITNRSLRASRSIEDCSYRVFYGEEREVNAVERITEMKIGVAKN